MATFLATHIQTRPPRADCRGSHPSPRPAVSRRHNSILQPACLWQQYGINRPSSWQLRARSDNREEQQGGLDPKLEVAVPTNQRPVNELAQLRDGQLYSWATLELRQYAKRLGIVWLAFFALLSGPIAYQTFDPMRQPLEWAVAGCLGSLMVIALLVLRIYLGWAYVGDRLLSASIAYEESGWYDGQTFVKPPEVLARDRLLGSYEVKPKLARLKSTLLGTGGALALCGILLVGLVRGSADADGIYGRGSGTGPVPRQISSEGIIFSDKVRTLSDLVNDEGLAAEEALAQGGVPGYCADRYFRAASGGQYCAKFDQPSGRK